MRGSTYGKVDFRLAAAEKGWRELTELVRDAAARPDYVGPRIEYFELVAKAIVALRGELHSSVLEVVRQTIGERR